MLDLTFRCSRLLLVILLISATASMGVTALSAANPKASTNTERGDGSLVNSNRSLVSPTGSSGNAPATFTWSDAGSLSKPRSGHTATLLPNGKVLVAGGVDVNNQAGRCELYDPAANTWSSTDSFQLERTRHSATLLANGQVMVAGGQSGNLQFDDSKFYDPVSGTWSNGPLMPDARANHTATVLQDGKVLVAGGFVDDHITNTAAIYDPTANTWSSAGSLITARQDHIATLLPNGKVLVAGGVSNAPGVLASAELYNPLTNSWSNAAPLTTSRVHATGTLLPNGRVLVAGGDSGLAFLTTAELYDPMANIWFRTEDMGASHLSHTATLLTNGKVLIAGSSRNPGPSAELYDPATGRWTNAADMRGPRTMHTATLLANGKVLAVGGYSDFGTLNPTAELYDPGALGSTGGPRIVFGSNRHGGNHDIYSMELDGSDQVRLTTGLAYDDQPKWSPNSSKIAFMSGRDGNFEIYTMNADGSAQTRITNNPFADGFPAWSPDGTKIAFIRGRLDDPSTFELYVMNADGNNEVRLTNDSAIDGVPSWSPDGTKIVFMSGGSSVFDPNSFEIYVVNADGSNRTRLTNNSIADGQPAYSPDGTKILFASGNALSPNGIEIFTMSADGSNRAQLTSNNVTDGFPGWSFDGSNIIFASGSVNDETGVELFVMNANGTSPAKLTTNSDLDWFPDWQHVATPPSQIQLVAGSTDVLEHVRAAAISLTRTGNTTGMASVGFATSDTAGANPCDAVTGTASARCDYETTVGRVDFAPGETSKIITVSVVDDAYVEGTESLTVTLSNPRGSGVSLGALASGTLRINDNDSVTGPNPLDNANAQFFVRQHYIDFLNREPDAAGLSFWTGQITFCGGNTQCLEIRRINVSAAFFLSIEFQETGYLVYRMYKAAYNPTVMPVPVRYEEFIGDTQQIGKEVVVGADDWEARLEANKRSFAMDFVMRLRFLQEHPLSQTPEQFVNALFTNAGVTPSPAERTSLINEFGGAPTSADVSSRARVLRAVAENATLKQQEFNKAFVLMQYFGYLRRNPFDAPEPTLDFQGYNFWLNKLNEFNGNFVNAEMVKAFIVSGEYRHRFGP